MTARLVGADGGSSRWVLRSAAALLLSGLCLLAGALPAAAHKLKVFATMEGTSISGFAFFVGGGRPHGAHVTFRDKDGHDLGTAVTDQEGAFSFTPAKAEDVTVMVDAGDGHSAETRILADRLAPLAVPASGAAAANFASTATASARAPSPAAAAPPGQVATAPSAACDPALIARLVDEAVARRIRPLLEAEAEAEDKVRFKDVVGGIGMIVGLFGVALWVSSRTKGRAAPPDA